MSALLTIFTLLALGLTLYILRLIQLELLGGGLDYPRYLGAVERSLDDPPRFEALTRAGGRLPLALREAAEHERGSLILRERGLERRARFESLLGRLKLIGTGGMLIGLFAALAGMLREASPEPQPLERLADPAFGLTTAELPLLTLFAGFGISLLARVGARMLQPRLHAELAAYAQLIALFEFRELDREKSSAHG